MNPVGSMCVQDDLMEVETKSVSDIAASDESESNGSESHTEDALSDTTSLSGTDTDHDSDATSSPRGESSEVEPERRAKVGCQKHPCTL